jgi:hypothetical protein
MNLAPCGPNDGGLVALKGGHAISKEYHDAFRQEERGFRWTNEVSRVTWENAVKTDLQPFKDVYVQGHRFAMASGAWI